MQDDDEPMDLIGFIPLGDQERRITQEEVDRSAAFTAPVLRIFEKIPPDIVPALLVSVLLAWCLKFGDPEDTLEWLAAQAKQALPKIQAMGTATRQ